MSDTHTSNIGFRVLLQQDARKSLVSGQSEDDFHLISCSLVPTGNAVTHRTTTEQERTELETIFKSTRGATVGLFGDTEFYFMEFKSDGVGKTFLLFCLRGDLLSSNTTIRNTSKRVQSIAYAKRVMLFFRANHVLRAHLNVVIDNNCLGQPSPSWKDSLPEDAVPTWASLVQTRMIAGSTDLLNVLNAALRHDLLKDGRGTSLADCPRARVFADFVRTTYQSTQREPAAKVFPLMLNVTDGVCLELPFGLSMYNRGNVFAGTTVLYQLLRTSIPAAGIGIVTFYPCQVRTFSGILAQSASLT